VRNTLLVLHIVAVAVWLGSNIFQLSVGRRFAAEGGAPAASWMASTVVMGRNLYGPAGVLILLTGVGLVLNGSAYSFGSGFVSVGFAVIIIGIILGVRVFGPAGEEAAAEFAAGNDARGREVFGRIATFGYIDTALVVLAVVAMVTKWAR